MALLPTDEAPIAGLRESCAAHGKTPAARGPPALRETFIGRRRQPASTASRSGTRAAEGANCSTGAACRFSFSPASSRLDWPPPAGPRKSRLPMRRAGKRGEKRRRSAWRRGRTHGPTPFLKAVGIYICSGAKPSARCRTADQRGVLVERHIDERRLSMNPKLMARHQLFPATNRGANRASGACGCCDGCSAGARAGRASTRSRRIGAARRRSCPRAIRSAASR